MRLLKILYYYLLGVLGILLISIAPFSIQTRGFYNIIGFIEEFIKFLKIFFTSDNWVYVYKDSNVPILEFLKDPYIYSAQIFISAIVLGFALAFILAILTNFLPSFIISPIKRLLSVLETLPDLMVVFLLQMLVVTVFKKTGVMLYEFTALGDEKVYLAPILTLSILPMISLYRMLLLVIEEEMLKPYTEYAKSKGMGKFRILLVHIFKNIFPSLFYHSKIIVWGSLSSLFIVETLFNMRGITYYIVGDFRPIVISVSLLMLFTPFFIIYQGVQLWFEVDTNFNLPLIKKEKTPIKKWKIWSRLSYALNVFAVHMKNPKFFIGFVFIMGVIIYSTGYSIFAEKPINQIMFIRDAKGVLISAPPHKPSSVMLLGSDRNGYSILDEIVVGAKYTLIFACIIAILRVVGGFILSIYYTFHLKESKRLWIEKIVDSIHFLPLSLVAYLLLRPILWMTPFGSEAYSYSERLILEVVVLTLLVLPLTTVLIGNEMKLISNEMFVLSAKTLGGNQKHILWKHIFPHLAPRLFIIFGQQFIQVLLIFVHLGIFQLFLGGTVITGELLSPDTPKSATYEWAGMIGSTREAFLTGHYWIIISVLVAFMLSILSMQLIVQGIKEIQQRKVGVLLPAKQKKKKASTKQEYVVKKEKFAFVRNRRNNIDTGL